MFEMDGCGWTEFSAFWVDLFVGVIRTKNSILGPRMVSAELISGFYPPHPTLNLL